MRLAKTRGSAENRLALMARSWRAISRAPCTSLRASASSNRASRKACSSRQFTAQSRATVARTAGVEARRRRSPIARERGIRRHATSDGQDDERRGYRGHHASITPEKRKGSGPTGEESRQASLRSPLPFRSLSRTAPLPTNDNGEMRPPAHLPVLSPHHYPQHTTHLHRPRHQHQHERGKEIPSGAETPNHRRRRLCKPGGMIAVRHANHADARNLTTTVAQLNPRKG